MPPLTLKEIPGYPNYMALSSGVIISKARYWPNGRFKGITRMGEHKTINGYIHIGLVRNGKEKKLRRNRIMWMTFKGPIPEGFEINHNNTIRHDDRIDNLSMMTPSQNIRHSVALGKWPDTTGENNTQCKTSKLTVENIRKEYSNGVRQYILSEKYNLSRSQINRIVNNLSWVL